MRNSLLVVLIILVLGIFGYLLYQHITLTNNLQDPNYLINLQTQQQTSTRERIMLRLSSIMLLPDEVNPTIATISNVEDLKRENPEFYENAVNTDTLILYSELAIIYRDSLNKIINIAPILQDSN